ncbi:6138_t:CDS:2 [Funneliformis caledonium]|uniref:6138_t:CDS:1 n=1 Tax=Funneliformis caledonium TaxID=1117310 RepID=A0A9N8WBS9_9GLOM|nr:6138_t:CDS:2 [Funneliformis caledonium]
MSGWEGLYHTAAGDYNNGNYKDSYSNYLKATSALIYKLNHEVSFSSRDTVKTKPHNAAQLFTQLKLCVQRLEDILQNRTTNGAFSPLQPSSIADTATMITPNPTPQYLPLIPFSPLTRQSMHYVHELATVNQKVSIAKQKSSDGNNNLSNHRKLDEQVRQQKTKLDQVNNQIQSIAEVTLIYWDHPNDVSTQLTIIDSDLFKKVDLKNLKKDLTLKDKKAQACMDFHRYLTNSFTHQFMIYADTARSSMNPSRSAQNSRENIIAHAVKIAYYLLNVHRNFNSFAAIMKALTSPEVRRIRRLWVGLPSRTSQHLKELSSHIKKEDDDYKAYKEILSQKMESFRDVNQGMVVIPWMQPHYEEIKAITQSYTSGKSGDNTEVILSAPGQRKLASIFSLLEQCQSNVISTDEDEWQSNNFNGNRKVSPSNSRVRDTITVDGTPINLPLDLSCLGNGNFELHHWLVSRVYLTKQQLIDESIVIEPLGENEQLLCTENENEDEEEGSENTSVGRYDIGSEDSGDNVEAGSSSNHEMTNGSRSQTNKPSPNKLEQHNNSFSGLIDKHSKASLMNNHERRESTSFVNGASSTSASREISKSEEIAIAMKSTEEFKFNMDIVENDSVGTNSSNVTNDETTTTSSFTSKTKAIPIPKAASHKPHQHSLSPSSTLTNLNPNAQPFVPRYSLSSSAPDMGNNIDVSIKELEMGEKNKIRSNPTTTPTPTEATSSIELNNNTKEDDEIFVYQPDDNDDNDEGEGCSTEFVYPAPENDSVNKLNGVNKVDKSSESGSVPNSITVKLSAEGLTKV